MPNNKRNYSNKNKPHTRSNSKVDANKKQKNDDSSMENSAGSDGTPPSRNNISTPSKKQRTTTDTLASRPNNYQSLRRECNRSKKTHTNNQTYENTRHINSTYTSRVTFKFALPSTPNPLNPLLETLQELLTKLKEVDSNAGLIAWKQKDIDVTDALSEPEHIPPTIPKLLAYSPRIFPGKANKPNTIYAKFHIAHDMVFTDIQTEIDYWLRSSNHGMYYNMLQAETVVDIGWLLYSLRSMDAGALAEELFDRHGIEIGLRWKVIDQGMRGKIPSDQRISALHVETKLEAKATTIKALLSIYGRKNLNDNTGKPNFINFRFVTLRSSATNRSSITKLDRVRIRQKRFLSKICQNSSWDIVHLDRVIRENTCTLRTYIMTLLSSEYEDVSLFHSVDLDYNGDGFIFTYLPELKSEAETAIQTLYPLIRHSNTSIQTLLDQGEESMVALQEDDEWSPLSEDEIKSFFTQEAVDRTEDMYYDKKKDCIVDPLIDNNLEFVIEDDTFDQLLGSDIAPDTTTTEQNVPGRPTPRLLTSSILPQGDADSISTFGGSLQSRRIDPGKRFRFTIPQSSDDSIASQNTAVTTDAFNALNHQVQSITAQLAQNQLQSSEILNILRTNTTPPSTETAGRPSSDVPNAGDTSSVASERLE